MGGGFGKGGPPTVHFVNYLLGGGGRGGRGDLQIPMDLSPELTYMYIKNCQARPGEIAIATKGLLYIEAYCIL